MEAVISAFYHISPIQQLDMTNKQWLNLWYQIPRIQAEQSIQQARVLMYPQITKEGRESLWSEWYQTIQKYVQESRVVKGATVRSMVDNVRALLAKAGIHG